MPLEIKQDGPRGLTFPNGPVVETEPLGWRQVRAGQTTPQAQEGVATDGEAQATAQACPCRPRQLQGDVPQPGRESLRPPSPRGDEWPQPLRENAACAAAMRTEELPHMQSEYHAP
jgi:hypothetical protein